jgi:hypothetical protein
MKFSIKPNHTIENGVTVTIECSKGFHQQNADPAEIQCENGIWKGRFPICESKFDLISDLNNMTSNLVRKIAASMFWGKILQHYAGGGANNFKNPFPSGKGIQVYNTFSQYSLWGDR